MLTDDFLSAESAIKARLRERAPNITHVLSAADLEGVTEQRQAVPAAHVIYADYTVAEAPANGHRARITQTWAVVIVDRNVAQRDQAGAQRATVGPLVLDAMRALQGWQPSPEHSPLVPVDAPFQSAAQNGFLYVPIAFVTNVKIAGDHP